MFDVVLRGFSLLLLRENRGKTPEQQIREGMMWEPIEERKAKERSGTLATSLHVASDSAQVSLPVVAARYFSIFLGALLSSLILPGIVKPRHFSMLADTTTPPVLTRHKRCCCETKERTNERNHQCRRETDVMSVFAFSQCC